MEIEITRYRGIVNAFNHPRSLAKLIIVISLILTIVFGGITGIALVIKNYYPYKAVNSNEYGATIIQNEDTEVIYWLFNSAELWANSGIHVKKGDVISVRASGAFHTAIHHLVEDADKNKMRDKWLKPTGGLNSSDPKDSKRSDFRISPAHSSNTMLMQVLPDTVELKNDTGAWNAWNAPYIDGRTRNKKVPDIYVIGSERDKITIRNNGVLYFTINDIALTHNIIKQMISKVKLHNQTDTGPLGIGKFPVPTDTMELKDLLQTINNYEKGTSTFKKEDYKELSKLLITLKGYYKGGSLQEKEIDSLPLTKKIRNKFTELDYYIITNFVDAWFVDNAGSFLIVIEREKQQ